MRFSSTRTRHVAKPSVYFSADISLGARLPAINPDWQGCAWHPGAEIGPAPHVLVLTTADAQAAIARGVSAPIVLWAPQGQERLAHAGVTGALDAGFGTAGIAAVPGSVTPIASAISAMVLAVPITAQVPSVVASDCSTRWMPSSLTLPARYCAQNRRQSVHAPRRSPR